MSQDVALASTGVAARQSHVKVTFAGLIGTAIEWYDFFLYGTAAALVFNRLFSPQFDPLVGTIAAFATFAFGFLARPIGGIVFGHYGSRIGRKTMLYLTLLVVGVATTMVGVIPTAHKMEEIGINYGNFKIAGRHVPDAKDPVD